MKHVIASALLILCIPAFAADPIVTEATTNSTVTTQGNTTTTIKSPPATAVSPSFGTSNSDLCTIGVAGAVQTQILGISAGTTFTEDNCVRLKNAKTLYDMGMKVAAVSVMCQSPDVFNAMMNAGTPCPYDGLIGAEAKQAWETAAEEQKPSETIELDTKQKTWIAGGGLASLLFLLL